MNAPSNPADGAARCPFCHEAHPAAYSHCPRSGRALADAAGMIGRTIAGRYRVVSRLGEGGMGVVYVAEHLRIGRKVALKRLHPELASDARAVQRFQREARAAAATGHPHIVEILDLGLAEDGAPYLVMEHLTGASLAALLRQEGRLAPRRAVALLAQVLAALEAVHAAGIIHRDLKPDNVFVTPRAGFGEFVKVLDFGISKVRGEGASEALRLTRTGVTMGTPFYLSPEQARGMPDVDARIDLYAVGVMLYECLTGRLPFAADNYHALLQLILRSEPAPPSSFASGVDRRLDAVVLRSIGKDRQTRFQTARELLDALAPWGAEVSEGPALGGGPALQAVDRGSQQRGIHADPTVPGAQDAVTASGERERTTLGASAPRPSAPASSRDGSGASLGRSSELPSAVVRGAWVAALLEQVEKERGCAELDVLLAALPARDRERLEGVIVPMAWLPQRLFDALLAAAAPDLASAERLGRLLVDSELTQARRLLVPASAPAEGLARLPVLLRHLHRNCEVSVSWTGGSGASVDIRLDAPESALHARLLAGVVGRALEWSGARDVAVEVEACRGLGAEQTRLVARYRVPR